MTRETPLTFAKRYGISQMEMFKVLKDLKLNITRMSAQLNGKQAEQLTKYFENQRKGRERRVREAQRLSEAKRITVVNVPPVKVPQKWDKHCNCCGRDWVLTAVENQTEPACPSCVDHTSQKEEDSARAIRRACDHAEQFRADRDRYRDFAEKANSEKLAAFRSRMKWSRALAEVTLDHDETDEGVCWCGDPHPCRTWRKLEEANKGIHREVEKWASMPDDVLEEHLYGDRYNRMLDQEEIDIDRRVQRRLVQLQETRDR